MDEKSILIIENEQQLLSSMKFVLASNRFNVFTANNGKHALNLLSSSKEVSIDLIITDILMPELNGLEFIKEINKQNINIPIIAITAFGNKELFTQLCILGCIDYIEKPFDKSTLLERVKNILK